jgi:glycosyltransferase involved in cell wall biosynthesis
LTLGLFLAIGESLGDFQKKGQLKRLLNYNVKKYSQAFDKVYIYSYADEKYILPQNCQLIGNRYHLHRYVYAFLIPILNYKTVKNCNVLRGLQVSGGIPALVSKIILGKHFIFNYGYDYYEFAKIEKKHLQAILHLILKKPMLLMADKVLVPSKTLAQKLNKIYKNKIIYAPNGVDTKLFHPAKKKLKRKILQLVFIGRLEEQKNLVNLIEAAKLLKIPHTLTFYGSGSLSTQLTNLSKKLAVSLKIKAPVDYTKVANILRNCDVFVLPSSCEGSSKILLEAIASGCAIVASNIPQIAEIITDGKNGVLSDQDPESLKRAINKLSSYFIREKIGTEARILAQKNYEINNLLVREVSILKNLSK